MKDSQYYTILTLLSLVISDISVYTLSKFIFLALAIVCLAASLINSLIQYQQTKKSRREIQDFLEKFKQHVKEIDKKSVNLGKNFGEMKRRRGRPRKLSLDTNNGEY